MVDAFGTPYSRMLHVAERYRLIDGEAAAEAQRKHGAINRAIPFYGRGHIDPDTAKKGLQVEFTMEGEGVFTTPWSGRNLSASHRQRARSNVRRQSVFRRHGRRHADGVRAGFLSARRQLGQKRALIHAAM